MDKQLIFEKLKDIIEEKYGLDDINLSSHFNDDFGLDSLDIVETEMKCEKEFNISLDNSDIDKYSTVGELVDLLYARLREV